MNRSLMFVVTITASSLLVAAHVLAEQSRKQERVSDNCTTARNIAAGIANVAYGTAPHSFAARGDITNLRRYLDHGGNANEGKGEQRGAILEAAILAGQMSAVQLLLERGADPNTTGIKGGTPLTAAVVACHPNIAEVLIKSGARVTTRGPDGTPLEMANRLRLPELVRVLETYGAKR